MKNCNTCKLPKHLNEFEYQTNSKDKLSSSCKGCLYSARSRGAYKIPKGAICNAKDMARRIFKHNYNKVPECYREMIEEQRKLRAELEQIS